MAKIKAIVKRVDEEYGHITNVSNTLENLQKIVGGHIEVVPVATNTVIICNEEGKIRQLPTNIVLGSDGVVWDAICGDLIVCGIDGFDFGDITIDFKTWKTLLKGWGN